MSMKLCRAVNDRFSGLHTTPAFDPSLLDCYAPPG